MSLKELLSALGGDAPANNEMEIIELEYLDKDVRLLKSLLHQPKQMKHFHGHGGVPIIHPDANNSARLNHEQRASLRSISNSRKNKGS